MWGCALGRSRVVSLGAGTLVDTVSGASRVVVTPPWETPTLVSGVTRAVWVVEMVVGMLNVMRVVG